MIFDDLFDFFIETLGKGSLVTKRFYISKMNEYNNSCAIRLILTLTLVSRT